MKRRKFMKALSIGALSLPSILESCSKESSTPTGPISNGGQSPQNPGQPPQNPSQYTPLVNQPPYFEREYSVIKKISSDSSIVDVDFDGSDYRLVFRDENNNSIKGLKAVFYGEKKFGTRMFSVLDPQKRYLPETYSFGQKTGGVGFLKMEGLNKGDISEGGLGSLAKGYLVKKIKAGLPLYDLDKMCRYPGAVYLGDWSFNNLKQLNTNLNDVSAILSFIPFLNSVFGITSTTGLVLDGIDFAIDVINSSTSIKIDKDRKYSIYEPIPDPLTLFGDSGLERICSLFPVDINELFPLHPGNYWKYKDNNGNLFEMSCDGTKNINGKDLLVLKEASGLEGYFGFYGNKLKGYGFRNPQIGDVFFNPAIVVGDNKVNSGSSYITNSKVVIKDYPEITGTVKEDFEFEKRTPIVLHNLKPYGDCFQVSESFSLSLTKNGETQNLSDSKTTWFSKNVGDIKERYNGQEIYLDDYSLVTPMRKPLRPDGINSMFLVYKKISEAVRKMR